MSNTTGKQKTVKLTTYMKAKAFGIGYEDAAAGRGWKRGYDKWSKNGQWYYEAGRQLACYMGPEAPRKLKNGANPKPEIVRAAVHMIDEGVWV